MTTTSKTYGTASVLCLEKARQYSERDEDHAKPRAAFSVVGGATSSEEGEGDVRDYGSIKVSNETFTFLSKSIVDSHNSSRIDSGIPAHTGCVLKDERSLAYSLA